MDTPTSPPLERILAVLTPVVSLGAAAGCLLPWERLSVLAGSDDETTAINALHGSGILTCAAVMIALLAQARPLWSPTATGRLWHALTALAGVLGAVGTALYTSTGGYRPVQGAGFAVRLGPGLYVCAACTVLLAAIGGLRLLAHPRTVRGQSHKPAETLNDRS